jgi:outer membrane protein assembly factor BamD (BamD/ComL family)
MMTDGISSQFYGPPRIQPSAEQQEFRSNVKSLIDAIKSGDLNAAKDAYAKIGDTASSKTDSNSDSPFAQLISQIGEALDSGDIDAAKDALSSFEANRPSGPPPGGGAQPGGPSESERSAFKSLVDALKSDNLDSAKTAYADLLQAREDSDTAGKSPIDSFLEQIGAALNSDDLDSAQAALDQLAQHRPHGGAVDVSA